MNDIYDIINYGWNELCMRLIPNKIDTHVPASDVLQAKDSLQEMSMDQEYPVHFTEERRGYVEYNR